MKKKNIFAAILSLVMLLMVTACGSSGEEATSEGSSGDTKVIGVALSSVSDTFRTYIYDAMNEEAQKHPDIEFVFSDAQDDSARQLNQIENYVSRNVDAIVLMPVDTVAAPDIVTMANNADIPIVVVNQTFDGIEEATAFVGSTSIKAGLMQMEEVAKWLEGKGNIAIIEGGLGHENQVKRTEGNHQIVDQHPGMEVVAQNTGEWSRTEAMRLMENWLQSGRTIDAVVANSDEMAIGALLAIEAAGKLDDIIIAGIDATPDAMEYMNAGKLEITVFQDAKGQGAGSIQTAVKAANGEQVESIDIPFQLVTQENADKFVGKN
ncbi:sugar ABC transporter substrate-binding protein [Halalkalibacter alkaliphilus]|uniref:Sugar ABC transporter substrate-binding protein n=1 Tax=Halalkalibacter alkaliphilus TaxID=2917993 RepID=A0A9X2I593_9BACI|nr:sugar ABC transporter substrate-binding protein [Halalkalibacter alkaliphilus]MCL7748491.1 sugar ABC transporter substrate-binding protein [Halalkalibacter alkaliphilus]